jgi:hypothetical protein
MFATGQWQKFSEPSIDDNPVFVSIYTPKALAALGFVLEGVDLETGMPNGNAGLAVSNGGFRLVKLFKQGKCYGQLEV